MEVDRGDASGDVPNATIADEVRAAVTDTEHLALYHWAAMVCSGRRVLDAGCGLADGSRILMAAGAREVVAVDNAPAVLATAQPGTPPSVTLDRADLHALPYDDGAFDAVVCVDVIEHVERPVTVLDELTRVLAPAGLLVLSAATCAVDGHEDSLEQGDPDPGELMPALHARYSHVRLYRQVNWITSTFLDDDAVTAADRGTPVKMAMHKMAALEPVVGAHSVVIASRSAIPASPAVGVITMAPDVHRWMRLWDEQETIIRDSRARIRALEDMAGQRDQLRLLLYESEQGRAMFSDEARTEVEKLRERVDELEKLVAAVNISLSWRVTAPLRRASAIARWFRRSRAR